MASLTDNNKTNLDKENNFSFSNQNKSFSIGKMIFLFIISLILCTVGPLSLFAPVPLALAFLIHGRRNFLSICSIAIISIFALGISQPVFAPISGLFLFAAIYAIILGEMISRNFHPHKIIIYGGGGLLLLIVVFALVFFSTSSHSFTSLIENLVNISLETLKKSAGEQIKIGGADGRVMQDIIAHPEKLVLEIKNWIFPFTFSGIFISVWGCLLIILRNSIVWRSHHDYSYQIQDLLNFKTPYFMVYPLITGLVLLLIGPYDGTPFDVIGGNIVYCIGVFYFFQGFGVFSDLLTHWNLFGIIRSFVTIIFIFSAWKILTLVGVFDVWVNFRKFFKNSSNDNNDNNNSKNINEKNNNNNN